MKKNIAVLSLISLLCGCGKEYTPKVIETQTFTSELAVYYESLGEIAEASEAVVKGKTTEIEYFMAENGIIWTKQRVFVEEILSGDIDTEPYINIYRMGGSISLQDYIGSYPEAVQNEMQERYKKYNKKDLIRQVFNDAGDIEIGQNEVAFLSKCRVFSDDENDYWRVGAEMGELLGDVSDISKTQIVSKSDPSLADDMESEDERYAGYMGEYSLGQIRELIETEND